MNRRGFLSSVIALGVAPAIVRADSLMRVVPRSAGFVLGAQPPIWVGGLLTRAQGGFIYESFTFSMEDPVINDGSSVVRASADGRESFILRPGPNGWPTLGEIALSTKRG